MTGSQITLLAFSECQKKKRFKKRVLLMDRVNIPLESVKKGHICTHAWCRIWRAATEWDMCGGD